jgi:hypothetical protein
VLALKIVIFTQVGEGRRKVTRVLYGRFGWTWKIIRDVGSVVEDERRNYLWKELQGQLRQMGALKMAVCTGLKICEESQQEKSILSGSR